MGEKTNDEIPIIKTETVYLQNYMIKLNAQINLIGPVEPLNRGYMFALNLRGTKVVKLYFKTKTLATASRRKLAEVLLIFRMFYFHELRRRC